MCSIDAGRVRRNVDAACITITELADTLVRDEGLGFRRAHAVAAATASAVIEDRAPLSEGYDAFHRAFLGEAGREPRTDERAFRDAVAIETFVARRDRPGGPAPAALDAAFGLYDTRAAEAEAHSRATADRYTAAQAALSAAFAKLETD